MASPVEQSATLDQRMDMQVMRYSRVWEDHRVLEQGLEPGPDDEILSIASAGCNVLNLLLYEPRRILAIDLSPAQAALLRLKLAALRRLDHPQVLALVGLVACPDRLALFGRLEQDLPLEDRAYWSGQEQAIKDGVERMGRLDRYFEHFARVELPAVCPPEKIQHLLRAPSLESQAKVFSEEVDSEAFASLFGRYFSREMLEKRGRDPAQLAYVQQDALGEHFWARFREACQQRYFGDNFYTALLLTGAYLETQAVPPWLLAHNHERLRRLLSRVEVVVGDLQAFLDSSAPARFSKANLSDVFEYMSEEAGQRMFAALARALRPGGRLAYWNLLVPRERPEALADRLKPLCELAQRLSAQDRCWFYRAFHVEEVLP